MTVEAAPRLVTKRRPKSPAERERAQRKPAELADQVQVLASDSMVYAAIRCALRVSHDKHPGT